MYRKPAFQMPHRVVFQPNNPEHIDIVRSFLITGNWKNGCPFYLEDPFFDIPTMIQTKVAEYYIMEVFENNV